jgi:hypothetical protein
MPTPFDLMTEKLDPDDPEDQLDQQVGQDQGANLAGGPQAQPDGQPDLGPQPASPNVPGPLAALAPPAAKPKIRLLPKKKIKPHIKLKAHPPMRIKPHIKLKLGGGNALL